MQIFLDNEIIAKINNIQFNKTLLYTLVTDFILIFFAFSVKIILVKNKKIGNKKIGKLQAFAESIILLLKSQVKEAGFKDLRFIFPVISTFFLFILVSNLLGIVPGFRAPTSSLSTTVAFSFMVLMIGYTFGFYKKGFGYLKKFVEPTFMMLPMNIMEDMSSSFSLAMRLYGNILSGAVLGMVLTEIAFLSVGFPVLIHLLGFISEVLQAYIFSLLAMSFIANTEE
jgi:F-type H+-transporting ATPase subunit a